MVTVGSMELGQDRLIGCFQSSPTTFPGGEPAAFFPHLAGERLEVLRTTGNVRYTGKGWPESAVEHCVVRTEYRPVYRIHSKEYLETGVRYPRNWASSERKRLRADRYSPFGTEGFYFGLTLEAAEDEARFPGGSIDPAEYLILVLYCCFDNVLDLTAGCLGAVWEVVGLGSSTSMIDMYLAIMDPETGNRVTNGIGVWARERGFDGLIYPSARYGQGAWFEAKAREGFTLLPAVNFVDMGSHMTPSVAVMHSTTAVMNAIEQAGGIEHCIPVWAEPNLVLFDGHQVSGDRWGVVYRTFPLGAREEVISLDDAGRRVNSYAAWATDQRPDWLP